MTRNWKHTMQNKFKPYEIVIENRDPILWPNSPDAPAGFANIQRRKWKLWINPVDWNEFVRKSKYENEWILKSSWWASCPTNIVPYNNHYVVWREPSVASEEFLWRDYRTQVFDFTVPYVCSIWIWDDIAPADYVNWISAINMADLISQILSNYLDFQTSYTSWQTSIINVVESWGWFYISVDWLVNNLQITFQRGDWIYFDWSSDPEEDWIPWRIPSLFTIDWVDLWPCELFQLPPSWVSTYIPTPQIRYLKNDNNVNWISFEAYFNEADRWILDYEPEIYLYFLKWGGWYKNHTNRSTRKRFAHMAQTDALWEPISLKSIINPRLRWASSRVWLHNTEWTVDSIKPDMATTIVVQPFQFLWRINNGSVWIWTFPINPAIWNTSWTGSEYPPTLARRCSWDQDTSPNEEKTITFCFKLVIKNPTNPEWFPIESDISEIFKIRPNIKRNESDYWNRSVKVNR